MENELTVRRVRDVAILDVRGRLTLGRGTNAIREEIWELVDGNQRKIILNLAAVTHVDSSAVGELVASFTTVASLGGDLKLLKVNPRVLDVLVIAKLHMVFEIYGDETAAINSFSRTRPELQERDLRSEVLAG